MERRPTAAEALIEACSMKAGGVSDILMVKRPWPTLDIIHDCARKRKLPIAGPTTSAAKYAMVRRRPSAAGSIERAIVLETLLLAFKAGWGRSHLSRTTPVICRGLVARTLRACFPAREAAPPTRRRHSKQETDGGAATGPTLGPAVEDMLRATRPSTQALGSQGHAGKPTTGILPPIPRSSGDGVALLAKTYHPQPGPQFRLCHFSDRRLRLELITIGCRPPATASAGQ